MLSKKVLVSYFDRNKVIDIPKNCEGDVKYVTSEFKRIFSFEDCVNLVVVLQKFDPEWDTYVDLEETDVLENRDKLKAVVMPILDGGNVRSGASTSTSEPPTEMSEVSSE